MNTSIYILNLETSTKNCSVSLSKNGKLVALEELCEANFSHAEKLPQFIKNVLAKAKINFTNLNAVAVGKGPGSFTGLRIGISSAKGLCFGLGIKLIALPSLEILANAIQAKTDYIIPLLDARRQEVYTAVFNTNYQFIKETHNLILDNNSFHKYLAQNTVTFLGDGALKTKAIIKNQNATFLEDYHPSAKEMITLSYKKYIAKDFEDVAYFEPFYLKDFYMNIKKK